MSPSDLNRETQDLQDVRCSDCRHSFSIRAGLRSARCPVCGNIEYLALQKRQAQRVVKQSLLHAKRPANLASQEWQALQNIDMLEIEAIQRRFTAEWELWSMVTKNFQDPNFHQAYISHCALRLKLGKASQRYLQHQNIMALQAEGAWQAELADSMLKRVQAISIAQLQASTKELRWHWLQSWSGNSLRFVAFTLGGVMGLWLALH